MSFNKNSGNVVTKNPPSYLYPSNAIINWGLIRHNYQSNPYGVNTGGLSPGGTTTTQNYNYVVDGTNVDVIINDTGIQADHPEFTNSIGVTRVTRVDWQSISDTLGLGVSGWNDASYTDTDGHGTNVAGIATGKTYGWAKNANIIPLYLAPRFGLSSAEPLDIFEMMLYWHQHKGNSNPTIVNMSWDLRILNQSLLDYYPSISGGSYRGNPILTGQSNSYYQQKGLIPLTGNGFPGQDLTNPLGFPYTSAAYNAALGHLIDNGLIVCQAAGNNGFKIDIPDSSGGTGDYNNYITFSGITGNIYYHRGASPKDPRAIVVGALDTITSNTGQDQKVGFSCAGPGVDVYAAGTYIMSAGCTNPNPGTPDITYKSPQYGHDAPYFLNSLFNEYNDTGTSQATPQITGMCSLYLQAHPLSNIYSPDNCSTAKSWITNNATTNTFYQTGNATSYTNNLSLLGGQPRVAYQPIQGLTQIKNNSGTWAPVANVSIKTDNTTWTTVKNAWVKVDNTTWKQVY